MSPKYTISRQKKKGITNGWDTCGRSDGHDKANNRTFAALQQRLNLIIPLRNTENCTYI